MRALLAATAAAAALLITCAAQAQQVTGGGGGSGSGSVTSIATGCQATGGTITTTGTISTQTLESPNVATIAMNSYTLVASDTCTNVTLASGYTGGLTIPATATFGNGVYGTVNNQSGTAQTITITTNNIDGLTSFILPSGRSFGYHSDGTNYHFIHAGQNFSGAQRHAVADAAANMITGDQIIAYTSITASRIVTLPAASAQIPGAKVTIVDESNSVTPAIVISIAPTGADTIEGSNSTWVAIATARGFVELESNGSNAWKVTRRSIDEQLFTAAGTSTFNRVVGVTSYDIYGCGQGGGGGGGLNSASGSGGAGGGGGDCHWVALRAADLAAAAGTSTVTNTVNANAGAAGAGGTQGGSSSITAVNCNSCTWFGGGGGGAGAAGTSTGGQGGGPWAVGVNASSNGGIGCGSLGGGSTGGAAGSDGIGCGGGGGGGSAVGVARSGGAGNASAGGAPGGGSGGGVNTNVGQVATAVGGGKSLGCSTPPLGGALNANGSGPTAADVLYHPGCGGAGGGGATNNTAGTGSAGTNGGGGGGGGSANTAGTTPVSGPGGAGGSGFVFVRGR